MFIQTNNVQRGKRFFSRQENVLTNAANEYCFHRVGLKTPGFSETKLMTKTF